MTSADLIYNDFQRYLAAKQSVDDRALNPHLWQQVCQSIVQHSSATAAPYRIVEIGSGVGTMVERLLTSCAPRAAVYTLVEEVAKSVEVAKERLEAHDTDIELEFVVADCFDFTAQPAHQGSYDLLIAHAVLDLFDVHTALPQLRTLLKPGGIFYATINFDGNTILQPTIDRAFDDQIEAAYHATMDARITNGAPSGDSRTGRHLFTNFREAGFSIRNAGSSDWVVFGDEAGYPDDEAYFLHFIVDTMAGALATNPALDQPRFAEWIQKRHAQIERGELVYIAHQLDFLVQRGD